MHLGPTLALFIRSVREDNRTKFPYIARLLLVLIVLFFLYTGYRSFSLSSGAPGLEFFRQLTVINAIFITLAGIAFFSTAITEEKEEMTLGLLRMTKLSPVAILLGKSTSRLFGTFLLILSQIPFTLLAVSLGGVTQSQVFAVYASLLAWIFFLSNLALFCSVVRSRNSGATSLTVTFLALLYLVPAITSWICFLLVESGSLSITGNTASFIAAIMGFLSDCEFVTQLVRILSATGYSGPVFSYQVGASLVAGLAFFALSWVFFNTFNREQKEAAPSRGFLAALRASKKPGAAASTRRFFAPPRSWPLAILWKDFYFFRGGWFGMLTRIAFFAVLTGVIILLFFPGRYSSGGIRLGIRWEDLGGIMTVIGIVVGALDLALTSGRVFASEAKWKTLSGLVMLPTTTRSLAYQKIAALALSSIPYLILIATGLTLMGPREIGDFFEGLFRPFGIYAVATFLLSLHLTAYFSLLVSGGPMVALIIAGCILLVGNFVVGLVLFSSHGSDEGIFIFLALCAAGICAYLQFAIARRLESMAASE